VVVAIQEPSLVLVSVCEVKKTPSVVLASLEHPIVAVPITVLQMSMSLKDIIPELPLVLELIRPQRPPATLPTLVFTLELMLLTKFPTLAVIPTL
jgi:hypothetical protein